MCAWIIPPPKNFIETVSVQVIWVDHVGAIALADGVMTTYYFSHRDQMTGEQAEQNLELIIKRPANTVFELMAQSAKIVQYMIEDRPPSGFKPRLVR